MSRRTLHFLAAKVATDALAANGKLPTTRSFSVAANIHPATARRWLVDLRRIIGLKAHDLPEIIKPQHQKRRSPDCTNSRGLISTEPMQGNSDDKSIR